ncbi:hypothetical protein [Stutzerimonas frequens]|uniref:hypothetical protein n=1 Tax=Stutzerimonas frequens TaxID=2968969 RepID=UPI001AAE35E0|nr:hypothetical protein [Stutzerimonas frequens]QTF56888.1 hypothetical protein J4H94_20385 [Stutzerimonas frequens]
MPAAGYLRSTRWAVLALLATLCSACLVIPVGLFNEPPYGPELLEKLHQADRSQVRRLLGEPLLTRDGGRYWYFSDSRTLAGIIGDPSGTTFDQYFWLLVRFDERGRVDFAEAAKLDECLTAGQCFDGSASSDETVNARNYRAGPDECAVYLYLQALPALLNTGAVDYRVDGRMVGRVNKHTYLFLTHRPGPIRIAAYDLAIGTECEAGDRLFIQAVKKRDFSWETGEDLAPVSQAEGEAAIAKRRLALPN